ncbi:hypothetical protein V2J09_001601 [Rumex salicifolius]
MAGLDQCGFVAVPRDSFFCLPEASGANKLAAAFETPCGRLSINPLEYMRMVNSLRPDWWVSLADEVPVSATEKRNKASVDRTVRWLDKRGYWIGGLGLKESITDHPSLLGAVTFCV